MSADPLVLPLERTRPDVAELHRHWRMLLYWDRPMPYARNFTAGMEMVTHEDAGTVCVFRGDFDQMGEEHLLCSVVNVDDGNIVAYPLAGQSLCEGSAESLELLLSGRSKPIDLPQITEWQYQTLPFAVKFMSGMTCAREATLLIGELSLSFGSPGISAVRLLKQLEEDKPAEADLSWLKGWVVEQIRSLRPEIEEAAQLEAEAIRRLQARWPDRQSYLHTLLDIQAEMVIRGLEARTNDPERFTLGLLPGSAWDHRFRSLMHDFPPLHLEVDGQTRNLQTPESHAASTAMDKALQLLLCLLYDEGPPDESFRHRGLNLNATAEGSGWRITSKVTDGTTDEDGLMCRALGLEGKLITISRAGQIQ